MTTQSLTEQAVRPTPTAARIDWIDRLRVWLTVLVVAHHSADTYSSLGDWYVAFGGTGRQGRLLTLFLITNQIYFMGAFFLLAGLFTPGAYDRRGPGKYLRDRLIRLGIPFLFYLVIVKPLSLLPSGIYQLGQAQANHTHFSLFPYIMLAGDTGVAWFLEVLIAFSLVYVAFRVLRRRSDQVRSTQVRVTPTPSAPPLVGLAAVVVALALVTFFWQLVVPAGAYWPIVGLPSPSYLPQYLLFFFLGAVAYPRQWLQRLPSWWAWPSIAAVLIGGVLFASTLNIGGAQSTSALSKPIDAHHLLTGAAEAGGVALFSTGFIVLLIIVFRRWFARPAGRFTRMLSGQSFLVYLIHPFVLTWVAVAIMGLNWPSIPWAALLFVISVPICWALAWLIRRNRTVRRVI